MSMILVVGLSGPGAPLDLIERTAVADEDLPKSLDYLRGLEHVEEAVLVSTCLRTEAYLVVDRYHAATAEVRRFFTEHSGVDEEEISSQMFAYEGDQAVVHLFRLACGLESASLGETEILGQLRRAAQVAEVEGAAGPMLSRLFRAARSAGRKVRVETGIGRGATSLAHAAVVLAGGELGGLGGDNARALVIGAGEVGTEAARALRSASADIGIIVMSRSTDRAAALADSVDGTVDEFSNLGPLMAECDLVLTCTSASEPVVTVDLAARHLTSRESRPLLLVDLGVPRDVDPKVSEAAGARVFDLDDIAAFAAGVAEGRRREVPKVEAIIADQIAEYASEVSARQVAPILAALHARGDAVRQAEIERHRRLLADLSGPQREAVESLTQALVAKLLHAPSVRLKGAAGTPEGERMAEALRHLYEL